LKHKGSALDSLGSAFSLSGNYTQAFHSYDKALAINPNDTYALDGKGDALSNQGNYTQAIQYYDKVLVIDSQDSNAFSGKQDAISKIAQSAPTSGFNRGCIDAQIPNPSERYINQPKNEPNFHSGAFMQVYNEGFDACSSNIPKLGETLK